MAVARTQMAGSLNRAIQVLPCPRAENLSARLQGDHAMTDINRRTVLATGAMFAVIPGAGLAAPKPPVVLFICEFGTAKSAIARELFRKRAKARRYSE